MPGHRCGLVGHPFRGRVVRCPTPANGVPDAPAVDIVARGVGTLVNDLSFPNFAPAYLSVPAAEYTLDVTWTDGVTRVRSHLRV